MEGVCSSVSSDGSWWGKPATATKPKKAKPAAAATITAADVQSLKDAIAAQQAAIAQQGQQIQELRDELRRKDQTVQQAQTAATDAAGKADAAQATATQQQETVTALKSDVSDLKLNMVNTVSTIQETQKSISDPPTALHFKGVTITPGGFLAAETVRRSRALAADVNTPLNSVTMPGASASNMSEFFGSGRQSRVSMLVEGRLESAKLSGYVEADFLSAGMTSNNNQSNSYTLRQRQVWGQAALDNGWTLHRRADVEPGDRNQEWRRQPHRSAAHDDRRAIHGGLQLGAAVRAAPVQELQQQSVVRGVDGKSAGDGHDSRQRQ